MSLIYTPPLSGGRRKGLYLGGQKDAKSREKLNKWGVTHILNVTTEKDSGVQAGVPNYFPSSYTYKRIPVYDLATSNLLQYAPQIVSFISKGLHHGSVLVHCKKGKSRSATCILFYLMQKFKMSMDKALELLKEKREGVDPIPAFLEQAREWEDKLINEGVLSKNNDKNKPNVNPSEGSSKRRIGPALGPTIGPSMGPSLEQTIQLDKDMDEQSKKRRITGPSIGPSLPPPSSSLSTEPAVSQKTSIGPQLPPSATSESSDSEHKKQEDVAAIGPSLPPSSERSSATNETKVQK